MSKLDRIIDVLHSESSLALSGDPTGRMRRREAIERTPGKTQRLVELGLHALAGASPNGVKNVLSFPYRRKGYEFIGSGAQATVLGEEDSVVKIVRSTQGMSDEALLAVAERLRAGIAQSAEIHPDATLPTHVEIRKHPLKSGNVVVLKQPKVTPDDYAPDSSSDQLADFAERSIDTMGRLGSAPDVGDPNNVVFVDGRLKLLDTIPVTESDSPEAYHAAMQVLESMARAKASVS